MKTIPRLLGTALLGLTLVSTVEAKPRQVQKPPQAAPVLTLEEVRCQSLGMILESQARARDVGVPFLTLVEALRRDAHASAFATEDGAWLYQVSLEMLPTVYELRLLSPALIRQRTELGCLKKQTAPDTKATDTRY
jgi:hypothetical protein